MKYTFWLGKDAPVAESDNKKSAATEELFRFIPDHYIRQAREAYQRKLSE